jgi:hypothetical protein
LSKQGFTKTKTLWRKVTPRVKMEENWVKKRNKQCQLTAKKGEKQYFEHSEFGAPDSIASKLNIFA